MYVWIIAGAVLVFVFIIWKFLFSEEDDPADKYRQFKQTGSSRFAADSQPETDSREYSARSETFQPDPATQHAAATARGIQDVGLEDTLLIRSLDQGSLRVTIDRMDRYEADGEQWFELSGICNGERVFVEWYEDEGLVILLDTGKDLDIEDLGLTEDDLVRMDDDPSPEERFYHAGYHWNFAESGEELYFENSLGEGEGYYCWSFWSEDGNRQISIDKFEDEPFEVSLSQRVAPGDLDVMAAQ
ncbi:hypothetical protein ACFL54_06030 [Planctomycetota bacterium]